MQTLLVSDEDEVDEKSINVEETKGINYTRLDIENCTYYLNFNFQLQKLSF